jgi:ATP-dependent Zn protease
MAEALLEKETLDSKDIDKIMGIKEEPAPKKKG